MGKCSNCTPNDELTIQIINPEEEDSFQQDSKQKFLKDMESKLCCTEFLDAQCESPNISQELTPREPSTSSVSASKETWLARWSQIGGVNKFLLWLLSFCLPIDGASFTCSGSLNPVMVCVPSNPPVTKPKECTQKRLKPVGMITRIKDADFIAGRLVGGCSCGRKNGLDAECPRMCCQDNPGCTMNPPQCWPQFKEPPPPPPPPPPQKIICVPIELVYCDPPGGKIT